jgi:hypothetical protein
MDGAEIIPPHLLNKYTGYRPLSDEGQLLVVLQRL